MGLWSRFVNSFGPCEEVCDFGNVVATEIFLLDAWATAAPTHRSFAQVLPEHGTRVRPIALFLFYKVYINSIRDCRLL